MRPGTVRCAGVFRAFYRAFIDVEVIDDQDMCSSSQIVSLLYASRCHLCWYKARPLPVRSSVAVLARNRMGSMASIFTKILGTIRTSRGNTPSVGVGVTSPVGASYGQPQVEPGSTLDTIAALNPSTALAYADAVACEIKQAIAACTIIDPATTTVQILEQIHSLKNAIVPTGSGKLLKDCEQLRIDASRNAPRSALTQGFKAVASAATLLVRSYRRTLSRDALGTSLSSDCNHHDPQA